MVEIEKPLEIVDSKLLESMCWIPTSRPVSDTLYVLDKYIHFMKVTAHFLDMLLDICFF